MNKSYILVFASALTFLTACSKKEDSAPMSSTTNLSATINGLQQIPANASAATGTFTGVYSSSTKQLTYSVTYQGFTPTFAHIHTGTPGYNGAVAIPFSSLTSPITGTVTLTADQADQLLNSGMYVNMHSTAMPNGEIRGNIHQ